MDTAPQLTAAETRLRGHAIRTTQMFRLVTIAFILIVGMRSNYFSRHFLYLKRFCQKINKQILRKRKLRLVKTTPDNANMSPGCQSYIQKGSSLNSFL